MPSPCIGLGIGIVRPVNRSRPNFEPCRERRLTKTPGA